MTEPASPSVTVASSIESCGSPALTEVRAKATPPSRLGAASPFSEAPASGTARLATATRMRRRRFTLGREDHQDQEEDPAGGENRQAARDENVSLLFHHSGRCRPPRSTSRRDAQAEAEQSGGQRRHRDQHEGANIGLRVGEGQRRHVLHSGPRRLASGRAPSARCRALGCLAGLAGRPLPRRFSGSARRSDGGRPCRPSGRGLGRWRLRRRGRLCRRGLGGYTRLRGRLGAWLRLRPRVRPKSRCRGRAGRQATAECQRDQAGSDNSAGRPQVRHGLHLVTVTDACKTGLIVAKMLDPSSSR